jgi:uncharacterized protein (TIGR03545 family)
MRIVRWKAVVPLALFLLVVGVVWLLLLDPLVEHTVEDLGTEMVGARVDVAAADVRLRDGVVQLRGLRVTNPDRPMTNLVEADEIVLNFRVAPLLEKKVIIDTVALRGLRFGTERETSGAIDNPSPTSRAIREQVSGWTDRIPRPGFSLDALRQVVDVSAISRDSLVTLREATALLAAADSSRDLWQQQVGVLNPRPQIDSARALVRRLEGQNVRSLGLAGARDAANGARTVVSQLARLDDGLRGLHDSVGQGVARLRQFGTALDRARQADYAYARGLLKIPSLEGPNLGTALFGDMVMNRVAPMLYWVTLAERYMPPGVEARMRDGPKRTRQAGNTVLFQRRQELPKFLVGLAEMSFEIGSGAGAGNYSARATDLTTAPALHGKPATFRAGRTGGQVGPRTVEVGGVLNHVVTPVRDSLGALLSGVTLPTATLAPLGARLDLGQGTTELNLSRVGDSLALRWNWTSGDVVWERLAAGPTDRLTVENFVWQTLSRLRSVQIDARVAGPLSGLRLSVSSNVARAVAASLQEQLGAEIRRVETQVRARVDTLVGASLARARNAVTSLETQLPPQLQGLRGEIDTVKRELEARIRGLVGLPGIGGS